MKKQRIFTKKHFAPLLILVAAFLLLATPKVNASAASKKPGAVTGFTAKSDHDYGGIKLKWKKVRNAKYYEIYWKKSKKKKFERYRFTTDTPGYGFGTDSDFPLGKTYYFKVRAVNGNKKGKFSPVKSAKSVLRSPNIEYLSLKSENSVSMDIYNGYNIELYRATSENGKYSKIKTFKNVYSVNPYIDTKLLPGKYFYKVRNYTKIKGKKVYSKFSPVESIIVPKKVDITMDNWMQYYEVSPCNSNIHYNAFGEIEFLYHQHTLQLKNNYILHDSCCRDIAKSSIAVEVEYTAHEQEAIIDWQTGKISPGTIVSDNKYTRTETGSISENENFYLIYNYLSKSSPSPTIETIENITMKRIQGTIYLDKW